MQLSTNEFTYDYKEGKPAHIYFKDQLFAVVYCYESGVAAITQFLNDNHRERPERQIENRLHNDKLLNPATGEPY